MLNFISIALLVFPLAPLMDVSCEIFPGNFCFYTMKSSQFPSFCPDCGTGIYILSIFGQALPGNIFQCGFSVSHHVWLPYHDASFPDQFHGPH